MGQKKINQLAAAGALTGSDLFEIEQSSSSRKVTWNELQTSVVSSESGAFTVGVGRSVIIAWTVGAVNIDATLSALASGVIGDTVDITKVDAGAGYGTIKADAGDTGTIKGLDEAELLFDQYNRVRLRHMGTFWAVIDLESVHYTSTGDGHPINQGWRLHADGTQEVWEANRAFAASVTMPRAMYADWPETQVTGNDSNSPIDIWCTRGSGTYTNTTLTFGRSANCDFMSYRATGRWCP